VRAAGVLVVARVAALTVPYMRLRRGLDRIPCGRPRLRRTAREWGLAIDRAAAILPGSRCLARAIAAEILLRRTGLPVQTYLGVNRDDQGRLRAHAWVVSGGDVVVGGPEAPHFAVLTQHIQRQPEP
jgi:hypothetical protein